MTAEDRDEFQIFFVPCKMHARKIQNHSWHGLLSSDRFAAGAWVILSSRDRLEGRMGEGNALPTACEPSRLISNFFIPNARRFTAYIRCRLILVWFNLYQAKSCYRAYYTMHATLGNESHALRTAFKSGVVCLLHPPGGQIRKPSGLAGASGPEPAPRDTVLQGSQQNFCIV